MSITPQKRETHASSSALPNRRTALRALGIGAARRQKGMATVLMALLVGGAVMASTFTVVQYVRANQDQTVTVHALTQAQMNAWSGAEMVRKYIEALSAEQLTSLVKATPAAIDFSSAVTGVSAVILNTSTIHNIQVQITGTSATGSLKSKSSVTIEITYNVTPAIVLSNALTAGGGLNLNVSNGLTVNTITDSQGVITVNGNVIGSNYNISGIKMINATGSIALTDNGSIGTLNSNCDVELGGGMKVLNVNATRHICETGGNPEISGVATANGSIRLYGGASQGTMNAIGGAGTCNLNQTRCTVANVGVDMSSSSNPQATSVNTNADLFIGYASKVGYISNNVRIGGVVVGGAVYSTSNSPTVVGGNAVGGAINRGGQSTNIQISRGGIGPSITPVQTTSTVTGPSFDASSYKVDANYAFYLDTNNIPKVDIQNINGVTSGTYYVKTLNNQQVGACLSSGCNSPDWPLCDTTKSTPCLAVPSSQGGAWTIDGNNSNTIVPGVIWFNGPVNIPNGITMYNTVIATGDISVTNNANVFAPNYVGYSGAGAYTDANYDVVAPRGMCAQSNTVTIITGYPNNFCVGGAYVATAADGVGSYALMSGGNLTLAASTVYGNVLAYNAIKRPSGNVVMFGYSLAQGNGVSDQQSSLVNTTFNLQKLPSAVAVVGLRAAGSTTAGAGNTGTGTTATILYSRYL